MQAYQVKINDVVNDEIRILYANQCESPELSGSGDHLISGNKRPAGLTVAWSW